jgi:16S rRNA (guanine527-N7)-methyltransferase
VEKIAPEKWNSLLLPYLGEPLGAALLQRLEIYLDLLLRWNAKMNLTAIRDPESIIRRHFGESLFVARHLQNVPRGTLAAEIVPRGTLLDHGSGAGFPGLPIGLAKTGITVTLSESQQKKASFLKEVIRSTEATNIQVHSGRTEALPAEVRFDWVALRAVDDSDSAYPIAAARVAAGGHLVALEGSSAPVPSGFGEASVWKLPESETVLRIYSRQS